MIITITNNSTETRTWCGQTIPAGESYTLNAFEQIRWENDEEVLQARINGVATIDALSVAYNAVQWGLRTIAVIGMIVDSKDLDAEQISQLNTQFSPIVHLLQTGSLNTAAEVIVDVDLTGTGITEEDRTTILTAIAEFVV